MPGKPLTPEELEYIKINSLSKTDIEIAEDLKKNIKTIISARKRLGITKRSAGKIASVDSGRPKGSSKGLLASKDLTDEQRKNFFRIELANNIVYSNLKQQFSKDELDFYLEEWGSLCVQFEDIVATEKRQIDEYIKAEILCNRLLESIKVANDNVKYLGEEIDQFRKDHPKIVDDELLQERDRQLMDLSRNLSMQAEAITQNYSKFVDAKNKILGELNGRRKDRVESIKKGGSTFIGLIEEFRNRELRANEGRIMELTRIAKEKKKAEWRQVTTFPGGTSDAILIDQYTDIKEAEIVEIEDKSFLIAKYCQLSAKKVLILDTHPERAKFFIRHMDKNALDFFTSEDKVANFDIYNLICLDSELKSGSTMSIIDKILKEDICKQTEFLLHSEDENFVREAVIKLAGKRKLEICCFKDFSSGK